MLRVNLRPSHLVLIGTLALSTTACGAGTSGTARSTAPSATVSGASPTGTPLADRPPAEILQAARTVWTRHQSVHLKGKSLGGGQTLVMDVTLGHDSMHGNMTIPLRGTMTPIDVIRLGDVVYVKSTALWQKLGGRQLVQGMGDSWGRVTEASFEETIKGISIGGLSTMFDLKNTFTNKGTTNLNGRLAVHLASSEGGSLFIAAQGDPLLLQIGTSEQPDNLMVFTNHGAPFNNQPPANVRDLQRAPTT